MQQNKPLNKLEWKKLGDKDYFEILSSGVEKFDNNKEYLSTESIQNTKIKKIECKITYNNKPSRANMQPILNSVWFARMQNTLKVYCFNEGNLEEIKRFILSTGFCGIKVNNKKVDPRYIKHFFVSNIFNKVKDSLCSGATQKAIKNESIKRIEIPVPPFDIQKKIVSILEKTENLKEKRKKASEETDKIIQSIFYEMFGNPTKNEKNWSIKKLDEVCDYLSDGSHFTPKFVENGVPFITVRNLDNGKLDFNNCSFISKEDFLRLKKNCNPIKGDVLFSKDGTVGKVAVINFNKEYIILSSLAIIRSNKSEINPTYLGELLKNKSILKQALDLKSGSAIRRIIVRDIKKIKIFVPPIKLQNKFAEYIEKIEQIQIHQQKSEQEINILFDALMQKTFNGELAE